MNSNRVCAITSIKEALSELAENKRQLVKSINQLRYDDLGNRRPETGPERSRLRNEYNSCLRTEARSYHLALGFLYGIPYTRIEHKCHEQANAWQIHKLLLAQEGYEALTTSCIHDWLIGVEPAKVAEVPLEQVSL